jgi:hypothetical protein
MNTYMISIPIQIKKVGVNALLHEDKIEFCIVAYDAREAIEVLNADLAAIVRASKTDFDQ